MIDRKLGTGTYDIAWDAADDFGFRVPAGMYIYQLRSGDFIATKKMILMDGIIGNISGFSTKFSPQNIGNPKLLKSNNLSVTIRANSARIQFFEQKNIIIPSQNYHYDINITLLQESVLDKEKIVLSEPSIAGKVYISGLAKAVIDTVLGREKVKVTNERTQENVSMRVDYDGGFPLMYLDGSSDDIFSITLFSDGQQLGDSLQLKIVARRPPKVKTTSPTHGDKDIVVDARIFIHFTEPMDTSTITNDSFILLNGGPVKGTIYFNHEDNTSAAFSPKQPLNPMTKYTFTVKTDIKNSWGMPMEQDCTVTFTTGPDTVIGGFIAFHSETRLPYDKPDDYTQGLYIMDSDGNILDQLTKSNTVDDLEPCWSPDGTRIAFTRKFFIGNGDREIYLMNSDGTFPENLTNNPTSRDSHPALSPDGTKIAFATERDDNREIYVMNVNGTDLVNLTNHSAND